VAARVLAADQVKDVAVLWIDPAITAPVRPVPLDCAGGSKPPSRTGRRSLPSARRSADKRKRQSATFFASSRMHSVADFRLASGSMGGPVFGSSGGVVGLSSVLEDEDHRRSRDARIVPVDDVCGVLGSAMKAMQTAQRPPPRVYRSSRCRRFPPARSTRL
jgi:hypothetical protein